MARKRSRRRAAAFEIERVGGFVHLGDEFGLHATALAAEERLRFVDQRAIAALVDAPDARR